MLSEWISSEYLSEDWMQQATSRYGDAQPYPHANITGFLRSDKFEDLADALAEKEFTHKESDLFSLAQTSDLAGEKDGVIGAFVSFLNSPELRGWIERLTGQPTTPGRLDLFGAVYQDTDYLLCHDDQLEDRKIAFILYLTSLEEDEGGALALYTDKEGHPDQKVKAYQPQENTLNLFTVTPRSWHEVEEVSADVSRVSLGGWLRG